MTRGRGGSGAEVSEFRIIDGSAVSPISVTVINIACLSKPSMIFHKRLVYVIAPFIASACKMTKVV